MTIPVAVFWDNSNIFIPAQNIAAKEDGVLAPPSVRINFENLFQLACAGRTVARAVCVGSVPPELESVWQKLRSTGVAVELYERGSDSGTEQGVDQCLQVHMLRAMVDVHPPGVAVLLTGDGAGYASGIGFHADLERMQKLGWGIEVLSWDCACNKRLKAWVKDQGVYIKLEDHYDFVTFIQGGRHSAKKIGRRPFASPGK